MRPLLSIFLTCLLAASPFAAAQTLDDANKALEKKEYEKARLILEKLVAKGETGEAELRLGEMYVRGTGTPRNTARGFALVESSANKGNPEAQFMLATELEKGELVRRDMKRAVELWRTSAKLKHPGAQYALCVEESTETSKFEDLEDAYAWCETSAAKKHKQSGDAGKRAKETLKRIEAKGGAEAGKAAKARAARYAKAY